MQVPEIIEKFFKAFWDSLFEHILLPFFWRPIMCLVSLIQKWKAIRKGTWPYYVTAEVMKSYEYNDLTYTRKFEVRVGIIPIPERVYVDRLVVFKEGGISEIERWLSNAYDDGSIPSFNKEKIGISRNYEVAKIDKTINELYFTDVIFDVPCEVNERVFIRVAAWGAYNGELYRKYSTPIKGDKYDKL